MQLAANKQINERFNAADDPAFVLAERGWHPGVIGIVAGRLAERHHRPVVLISWDQMGRGRASARRGACRASICTRLWKPATSTSLAHGGHAAAAGLKIEERQIRRLPHRLLRSGRGGDQPAAAGGRLVDRRRGPARAPSRSRPSTRSSGWRPSASTTPGRCSCATGATLDGRPRPIGAGGRHLSLRLSQHGVSLRAVAFGGGEWAGRTGRGRPAHRHRLSPGDQHLPRPPQCGTAPGRLAMRKKGIGD